MCHVVACEPGLLSRWGHVVAREPRLSRWGPVVAREPSLLRWGGLSSAPSRGGV